MPQFKVWFSVSRQNTQRQQHKTQRQQHKIHDNNTKNITTTTHNTQQQQQHKTQRQHKTHNDNNTQQHNNTKHTTTTTHKTSSGGRSRQAGEANTQVCVCVSVKQHTALRTNVPMLSPRDVLLCSCMMHELFTFQCVCVRVCVCARVSVFVCV